MPLIKSKSVNLEECILCQRKKRSEYLSSGDVSKGCIVSLAKQASSLGAIRFAGHLELADTCE